MNFLNIYIVSWVIATLVMLIMIVRDRSDLILFSKNYQKYIGESWKIITFLIATTILSAMAPIANDPTWDIPESIIMASLTFFTAPWAVGVIYRAIVGYRRYWREIYIAIIFWLFSSSWSYDLYVWIWQGIYPISWSGNLAISPILYLCAGIFWGLEWRKGHGAVFAFCEKEWFLEDVPKQQFKKLFIYMFPFILLGFVIFGGFLYVNM